MLSSGLDVTAVITDHIDFEDFETGFKRVAMLSSGLDVTAVITDHIDFEDFETGFKRLNAGEACKVVMRL
jgi:threonine 3-dehydrogenase